jgi:hypothetical protein
MAGRRIRFTAGDVTVHTELNDSPTADLVWEALPINGSASTWGDEIYFSTPVSADVEPGADAAVPLGAVAYWPPGNALCLFFGQTPASSGGQIRAASAVNMLGTIEEDPTILKSVRGGTPITVEKA